MKETVTIKKGDLIKAVLKLVESSEHVKKLVDGVPIMMLVLPMIASEVEDQLLVKKVRR